MLGELTAWLVNLVKGVFESAWNFTVDMVLKAMEVIGEALAYVVSKIPVPDFLQAGISSVYSQLDPGIVFLLAASGLPAAMAILASGYAFRLARKFATLFQW